MHSDPTFLASNSGILSRSGGRFRVTAVLVRALACLVCGVCAGLCADNGSPRDGGIDGTSYTNSFFRFTVPVPAKWTVEKLARVDELARESRKRLAKSDDPASRAIAGSEPSVKLLMMSRTPLSVRSSTNVLFSIVAHKGRESGRQPTGGKDLLIETTKGLKASKTGFEQIGEITEATVGGKTFHHVRYAQGERLIQDHFVAVVKGYALDFILTATSKEDLGELRSVVATVKFY